MAFPVSRRRLVVLASVLLLLLAFGILFLPYSVVAQGSATPTIHPFVQTAVTGSLTAIYQQTPTATRTPTPTPLGLFGVAGDGVLEVELLDYRYFSKNDSESAALSFDLEFRNVGTASIEVTFDSQLLDAEDNTGTDYGEYFAVIEDFWNDNTPGYICTAGEPDFSQLRPTFTLDPGEVLTYYDVYLTKTGQRGCYELERYRVGFEVDWIDVTWSARYRIIGDGRASLRLEWRLERTN